jgi:hypothetical protein
MRSTFAGLGTLPLYRTRTRHARENEEDFLRAALERIHAPMVICSLVQVALPVRAEALSGAGRATELSANGAKVCATVTKRWGQAGRGGIPEPSPNGGNGDPAFA